MPFSFPGARCVAALPIFVVFSGKGAAHEAWLLSPAEIEALSVAPVPELFRSAMWLGLAAFASFAVVLIALRCEGVIARLERVLIGPLARFAQDAMPLLLRSGLAAMVVLAAFGGLPRHGTALWTQPTFLVPDMQLSSVPGADALIVVQLVLGGCLALGLFTRLSGAVLVGLAGLGPVLFGPGFWSYSLHFAAPGLMLVALGGGRFSCDCVLLTDLGAGFGQAQAQRLWQAALVLIGVGFVYLAVAYKLLQPTLLIAILTHGEMPTLGLSMAFIALVMTIVELLCGGLLMMLRLVRPVSLAILGAITFLAIVLGETPLFHANLYGALGAALLGGAVLELPRAGRRFDIGRAV